MREKIVNLKEIIKEISLWKVNKDRLNLKWDNAEEDEFVVEAIKDELELEQTCIRKAVVDLTLEEVSIIDCVRSLSDANISDEIEIENYILNKIDELKKLNRGIIVRNIMNDRKVDEHLIKGMNLLKIEF